MLPRLPCTLRGLLPTLLVLIIARRTAWTCESQSHRLKNPGPVKWTSPSIPPSTPPSSPPSTPPSTPPTSPPSPSTTTPTTSTSSSSTTQSTSTAQPLSWSFTRESTNSYPKVTKPTFSQFSQLIATIEAEDYNLYDFYASTPSPPTIEAEDYNPYDFYASPPGPPSTKPPHTSSPASPYESEFDSTTSMPWLQADTKGEEDDPLQLSDILPKTNKIYDKMRPPKQGNATKVLFHVTVMSLDTIDESSMTYTCDIFFAQSWKDYRLMLPDNMTSEYRLLPVEWLTEIWRPDSFFKNAKSVTFQTMTIPNHYIWLYQDKSILYMVKLTLVLSCAMNFKNYPHDEQLCNLKIESISHTTDDLIFEWDPTMPLDVDRGIELPQLELTHNFTGDCTTAYSTGNFTCLEVVFKFKRRLGYYLFHTYVPTCLIVIMSWISFWIKPEAVPARVTLGVTSLLTLSTQHANSQKSLPPVSYIKAIDVFMSGCTVFVFLSLMEYALVNIVMGDIADIEKKKSKGLSTLLLGAKPGAGIPQGGMKGAGKSFHMDVVQEHLEKEAEAENGVQIQNMYEDTGGLGGLHRGSMEDPLFTESVLGPPSNGKVMTGVGNSCAHQNPDIHLRSHVQPRRVVLPPPPPPPSGGNQLSLGLVPGMTKDMASEAHAKRQKEIRDLMKKRREKAVLVDRISRWLFPTSFILLNIVYWALFGDHDLW